ncbi:cation-transporting ATPase E [Microbacteriaceae bacterium MWH-Ta3]|nr:cation-transporting ATPase E [Microbacteriaceae bacterium MWH-Ta3]
MTIPIAGLSASDVAQRIAAGQTNVHDRSTSRRLWHIVRSNVFTLFNGVVGGAFIVLLALGEWKDALFGFAMVANVLIGIIQEYRSKRTLDRLVMVSQPNARVLRDGVVSEIAVDDVVLDDVLVLMPGDQLVADAVVLDSAGLELDESLLTGESEPVDKAPGDTLLAGSSVTAGTARARAFRVGDASYANTIAVEARQFSLVASELRGALNTVIRWISWALVPLTAIIANGQMQAVGGWATALESGEWRRALVGAVASVIGMVPQGLVLITSIAFAVAAAKLAARKVLVQELPAVEGLARVDVVCFDKTGTLTMGDTEFHDAVLVGEVPAGAVTWIDALGHFGHDDTANATAKSLAAAFTPSPTVQVLSRVAFSSVRKWSACVLVDSDSQPGTWYLGAPEMLLNGNTPGHREALAAADELASSGLRTLVLAHAQGIGAEDGTLPSAIVPVAVVTFTEKLRFDAAETLRYFAEQGVSVRIISGDNPATVAFLAHEAGLVFDGDGIDSRGLPTDIEALAEALHNHTVFGRVTPEQKRDMVVALQHRGHVVAMTGDGVNDALALKKADLGIAMGTGSAATKAVARVVLLDNRFASLPEIVGEGRRVIANVERVSRLFLTKTSWAMTTALVFGIALWAFPFLPRQLSAVDGFAIGIPAFALALLPNARRYVPGFLARSLAFCIPAGVIVGGGIVAVNVLARSQPGWDVASAQTATSLVIALTGLWVLTELARPLDRWRIAIVAAMYAMAWGTFTIPLVADFFEFVPLDASQWTAVGAVSASAIVLIEVVNQVVARRWAATPAR